MNHVLKSNISEKRVPLQADRAVLPNSMVKTSGAQSGHLDGSLGLLNPHPSGSLRTWASPLTLGWQEWMRSSRILPWTTASRLEPFSACQCSAPGGLNPSPFCVALFRPLLDSVNQPMRRPRLSPISLTFIPTLYSLDSVPLVFETQTPNELCPNEHSSLEWILVQEAINEREREGAKTSPCSPSPARHQPCLHIPLLLNPTLHCYP